jgi:hypothetical protein
MMGHGAPPFSALNPRRSVLVVLVAQLLGAGPEVLVLRKKTVSLCLLFL